jgi:hypothetical protein
MVGAGAMLRKKVVPKKVLSKCPRFVVCVIKAFGFDDPDGEVNHR